MQFVLEQVASHGARLGKLLFREGRGALDTPLCLVYTRGGAVPHLVEDLLSDLPGKPPAAMLCLPHLPSSFTWPPNEAGRPGNEATLYHDISREVLAEYKQGIHSFLSLQEWLLYLSIQDPCAPPPPGYNERKNVTIWTIGGRKKLTVADHLNFVEVCRPSVFECLCDSAPALGSQMKRVRKSVDRTLQFLDDTLTARAGSEALGACAVLGAVVGGDAEEERTRSAVETAKRPVDGFVLEGFDLQHSTDRQRSSLLSATQFLPADKPRFIHGMKTPEDIFTAVECGVDVFDGSYPYTATEQGVAIVFPISCTQAVTSSVSVKTGREVVMSEGEGKTFMLADREGGNSGGDSQGTSQMRELDLKEQRYATDLSPVLPGCQCYCCSHHSRAYLHHLLVTKEILASVLLMVHNLTHYLLFFQNLRLALRNSCYSELKDSCLSAIAAHPVTP